MKPLEPHGGQLINRIVTDVAALEARAAKLERITLDARELADLELIAVGAASPLTGFLEERDYHSVLESMKLANGVVWPLPITLAVDAAPKASEVALVDASNRLWAVMKVSSVFTRDPMVEALKVLGTDEAAHPGVSYLLSRPRTLLGGLLEVMPLPHALPFAKFRLTPEQLRAEIAKRGWKTVAGFQTRNPIHRAHEYLTKLALEACDGLVLHPLVGETKRDDVPANVRFEIYETLVERYYPRDRVILAAFPAAMRYAGPREALFHAIVRKNYGIDSLIVGRDHAGVAKYYPPTAAQEIFDSVDVGVKPLRFEPTFYCRVCEQLASSKTCPHGLESRVELSGSKVRDLLRSGQPLPREFTRPEVADILRRHYNTGFVLWFTGLSGSGKTTLAELVRGRLGGGRPVEMLDGDEIRLYLSKGLGFSKEDRDTNTRRIGFVARTLARNGVIALASTISPYADTRLEVRNLATRDGVGFIEIHVDCPLEVLVERDVKGLYKQALAGELDHFTGVSDPYEVPTNPELRIATNEESQEVSVQRVLDLLKSRGLLT